MDTRLSDRAVNTGAKPVTYGQGDRPPRGDYAAARADYTCEQDWAAYTPEQHALYRRLYERQAAQIGDLACREFIAAVQQLGTPDRIPRFDELSEKLMRKTGWQVVAVPGLIPDEAFFNLLAARKFPVTGWLRKPEEFDYIVEPDVFHDLFGHVPLLFDPVFADYMQAYGAGGMKASRLASAEHLARLYWYTVEFGLIRTDAGLRAYGAGILSSAGELRYGVTAPEPQRIAFDLERIMRTQFKIDSYQQTYFVIDSFAQLFEATAPDFTPIYAKVAQMESVAANAALPGDRRF
jgi:phenylalanine-4-hydroxylase